MKLKNIQHPETSISPRRRLFPPACKPNGLEAEPEARINQLELKSRIVKSMPVNDL
jgi:hypothetical protein